MYLSLQISTTLSIEEDNQVKNRDHTDEDLTFDDEEAFLSRSKREAAEEGLGGDHQSSGVFKRQSFGLTATSDDDDIGGGEGGSGLQPDEEFFTSFCFYDIFRVLVFTISLEFSLILIFAVSLEFLFLRYLRVFVLIFAVSRDFSGSFCFYDIFRVLVFTISLEFSLILIFAVSLEFLFLRRSLEVSSILIFAVFLEFSGVFSVFTIYLEISGSHCLCDFLELLGKILAFTMSFRAFRQCFLYNLRALTNFLILKYIKRPFQANMMYMVMPF
ncbi:hypothetical protein Avbf_01209 [Armadillidium vulgare]|nr:hypothetical protein Avbf_01209 [Armadillidium vulgare]